MRQSLTKLLWRPQVKAASTFRPNLNNRLNAFKNMSIPVKQFSTAGDFKSSIFIDMEDNTIDLDSENKAYQ
jgi:hypothetical protein